MTRYGTSIRFLVSNALSLLGNSVAGIALPLIVLATTGDALAAGTLALVCAIPQVMFGVLGGAVLDRFNRRNVSIVSDVVSAVSVALLPVVDLLWGLDFAWFAVLGVLGAVGDIPGMTARDTLAPAVSRRDGMDLPAVSGAEPVHRLAHDHRGAGRGGVPHRCGRGREHAVGHGRPLAFRRRGHHHHPPRRRRRAGRRRLRDAALRTRSRRGRGDASEAGPYGGGLLVFADRPARPAARRRRPARLDAALVGIRHGVRQLPRARPAGFLHRGRPSRACWATCSRPCRQGC